MPVCFSHTESAVCWLLHQGAKWEATALQATLDAGSCDIQRRHDAQQARLHLHHHSPAGSLPATLERCSSSAIPVPAAAAGVEMAAAFPGGAAIDMDLEASPTGCSPPSFGHQVPPPPSLLLIRLLQSRPLASTHSACMH